MPPSLAKGDVQVTSLVEVWIEICVTEWEVFGVIVTSLVEVWIEIRCLFAI